MSVELTGPDQRYLISLEALSSQDGRHFRRSQAGEALPLGEGSAKGEGRGDAPPRSYLVMMDETCSLILSPGQNGVTLRDLRLLDTSHLQLNARVTPGTGAPDWLPTESTYLLFSGDATAAAAQGERYVPFDGLAGEEVWSQTDLAPLDTLAVAVGRSIARANTVLSGMSGPGGLALLSGVTIRVGVSRLDLGSNRVMVTLARPEGGQVEQYVELSFQAGAGGGEEEGDCEGGT